MTADSAFTNRDALEYPSRVISNTLVPSQVLFTTHKSCLHTPIKEYHPIQNTQKKEFS